MRKTIIGECNQEIDNYKEELGNHFLDFLIEQQVTGVTFEEAVRQYKEIGRGQGLSIAQKKIAAAFVKQLRPQQICEAFTYYGEILGHLIEENITGSMATYIFSKDYKRLQESYYGKFIDYYESVEELPDAYYDCIVGDLPKCTIALESSITPPHLLDEGFHTWDKAIKLIFQMNKKLDSTGYILVFVSSNILRLERRKEELERLGEYQLYLNGVLELSDEADIGPTMYGLTALIFSKHKKEKRYFRLLNQLDEIDNDVKDFFMGMRYEKYSEYWKPFLNLYNSAEVKCEEMKENQEKALRGKTVKLKDIILGNNMWEPVRTQNEVIIPAYGESEVIRDHSDMIKDERYLSVTVDTSRAIPEYVACFYNTEYGKLIRRKAQSKQQFSLEVHMDPVTCDNMEIIVPPLSIQVKIVENYKKVCSEIKRLEHIKKNNNYLLTPLI